MKLFVINLDRQPERLRRMREILDELGLPFTRVAAVDGTQFPLEEVKRWGTLRPGETAAFLSHRDCWRRVIEDELSCAAILEDDLHFGVDAKLLLGGEAWVPEEADVIKIETKLQRACVDKLVTATVGDRRLHRLRSRHAGAGGYVVTRKGAEKLLAMSARFEVPVDQFIFNPELPSGMSLVTVQLLPAVCVQDFVVKKPAMMLGLGSDLHEERAPVKLKGARKLWRELKRPFFQIGIYGQALLTGLVTDRKWTFVQFT